MVVKGEMVCPKKLRTFTWTFNWLDKRTRETIEFYDFSDNGCLHFEGRDKEGNAVFTCQCPLCAAFHLSLIHI